MMVWILGDQLSPEHAALTETDPRAARVLMIESKARASLLRYHQIKLVLVYSAMRHFAFELRNRGWEVDYYRLEEQLTFESALRRHLRAHRPRKIILAEPNSFAEAKAILGLGRRLRAPIEFVPTKQFLLAREDFGKWANGQRRLLMENHYRRMRKRFGWLTTEQDEPAGGKWNFDPENRETFATWQRNGRPRPTGVRRGSR